MKREMCPSVEALEAKALLSQVGVGMGAMRHQVADLTKHMGLRLFWPGNQLDHKPSELSGRTERSNDADGLERYPPQRDDMGWPQPGRFLHHSEWARRLAIEFWRGCLDIVRRILHPGQSLTLTANWTATATGSFCRGSDSLRSCGGDVARHALLSRPNGPTEREGNIAVMVWCSYRVRYASIKMVTRLRSSASSNTRASTSATAMGGMPVSQRPDRRFFRTWPAV